MADQFAIATQTTPASPGTLDITSGDITETVKAAIFFFGANTNDGSISNHGCLGVGMWANDGESGSPGGESFGSCWSRGLAGVTSVTDTVSQKSLTFMRTVERDATPLTDMEINAITAISGGVRLTFATTTSQCKITAVLIAGSARTWHSQIASTTVSAHENTGAGGAGTFQPDFLVVTGSDGAFSASTDANFRGSLGFVVGSSHAGQYIDIDDGSDPTDADGRIDSTEIPFVNATGRATQAVTFTIDSSGYNHQVTTGAGSPDCLVLAIKLASATAQKACDNLAVSGSAGTQSFSVGFQPLLVVGSSSLMASEDADTDGGTAATIGHFAFTSSTARAYTACHQEGVAIAIGTPSVSKSFQGDFAVATLLHTGTMGQQATLSSMTSTGFDLSFSTATAGFLTVLAIGAGDQTIVQSDTETISDDVLALLFALLVTSDTVTIAETVLLGTNDVSTTDGPEGYIFTPRAERGTAYNAGAEAGTSF